MSFLEGMRVPAQSRRTRSNTSVHAAARKQRGLALLVVLLIAMGLLAGMLAIGFAGDLMRQNQSQKKTADALAQAKDVLIGRAVSDDNRPGSLPCPDTDDDGTAELFSGSSCPSYIGRLPWRTLGLPEPRDAGSERLWYMLSSRFRDNAAIEPLSTDTLGNVTVYSGNSSTLLTTQAVAVVFAPGGPLGGQARSSTLTAICPLGGATVAQSLCVSNYLETASGINNATASGPYISATPTASFNDRLLVITTAELMTPVEKRAATEILALLQAYRSSIACDCYPWADNWDGASNYGTTRGRVPLDDADPNWSDAGVTIPAWLTNNDWWQVFYYAIAPMESEDHDPGWLTVDGVSGNKLVLITTGPASASRFNNDIWSAYLEDSQNSDHDDNTFITPTATAYARDRINVIP